MKGGICDVSSLESNTYLYLPPKNQSLRIQSPSQMMIGVYNHLLRKVFRFHYHSEKVIGSPRSVFSPKAWSCLRNGPRTLRLADPERGYGRFRKSSVSLGLGWVGCLGPCFWGGFFGGWFNLLGLRVFK